MPYAALARRVDLDAVLHLGDYIDEHANGGFGDGTAMGRLPQPDAEILALADYRARDAQYKADPDYFAMKTVLDRTPEERFAKSLAAPAGQMHLTEQASPAPPQPAPDPAP